MSLAGSDVGRLAGGAVRSSNVVRELEREAVACSWYSVSCSEPREELAMAAAARASGGQKAAA